MIVTYKNKKEIGFGDLVRYNAYGIDEICIVVEENNIEAEYGVILVSIHDFKVVDRYRFITDLDDPTIKFVSKNQNLELIVKEMY